MRKLALISALLAVPLVLATTVAGGNSSGIPGASGTLYVTERTTPGVSTVTAFDAGTGTALWTTTVGNRPIGVTQPHGTKKVYSSNELSNTMSVLDRETGELLKTIGMGPGPHHLMASKNGEYIYVGEFFSNEVGVVDTSLDERIAGYNATANEAARTHAVWITRDGKDLYATNEYPPQPALGSFSKLDARTGELIWEHVVGNRPSEILLTPDDKIAYVSVRNEDVIKVFDVGGAAPVQIGTAEAKVMPDTLSLTPDKKTLVVGLRGIPARMALIDTDTLATQYVTLTGRTTGHQWLSPNGKYTFIALEGPGTPAGAGGGVAVVDNEAREQIAFYAYPNGLPLPHGAFYEPQELR
jgi:DNA-binding beta-propeller fold protein YncE